jgi:Na+/H+ antiporter NhaD/arsenite permease-like protein
MARMSIQEKIRGIRRFVSFAFFLGTATCTQKLEPHSGARARRRAYAQARRHNSACSLWYNATKQRQSFYLLGRVRLVIIPQWLTGLVIFVTLAGVAAGQYPWLRMNRATIALVGATVLIGMGAIPLEAAYQALDMNTLVLLFAMMILIVNLRLAGFFSLVASEMIRLAHTPRQLLALIVVASGVLAALFLNDAIVLMLTPLALDIVLALQRNPIPYLIGLVTAANIGSAATIVGNPQNMIIGVNSGIPFATFTARLAPISLAGLFVVWGAVVLLYRDEFRAGQSFEDPCLPGQVIYRPMLFKGMMATGAMLVAFVAGVPVPLAALMAAAIVLVTRRVKPQRVFREVDFTLLVFFAGLFIVTGAIEHSGLSDSLFSLARPLADRGVAPLAGVAVVLSNLVSNVPAVLLFRPFVRQLPNPSDAWLTLAMATTFAGNLTLLGSVANLIVAEIARGRGIDLSFREYLKAGLLITLASLFLGVAWLSLTK